MSLYVYWDHLVLTWLPECVWEGTETKPSPCLRPEGKWVRLSTIVERRQPAWNPLCRDHLLAPPWWACKRPSPCLEGINRL